LSKPLTIAWPSRRFSINPRPTAAERRATVTDAAVKATLAYLLLGGHLDRELPGLLQRHAGIIGSCLEHHAEMRAAHRQQLAWEKRRKPAPKPAAAAAARPSRPGAAARSARPRSGRGSR